MTARTVPHIQRVGGWWVMTNYRGSRFVFHGRRTIRELCEDFAP